MSATSSALDYEQAGELKIGQVGIATLRIRTLDVARLCAEMHERVVRAPKLFGRAAIIIDFGGLPAAPDATDARNLLEGLRDAGVLPVALAYGTREIETLSEVLGVPLLAKFRAQYERVEQDAPARATQAQPARNAAPEPPRPAPPATPAQPGLVQKNPVRSGQQLYAENRDLTVLTSVGAGAEVIADGSIHIYGPLRGRALAGARGNTDARIFCRGFQAELVAIAGQYKVLEDVPKELHGKAVQVWLENDQLKIAALD